MLYKPKKFFTYVFICLKMRPIGRRFWAFLIKKYDNQSSHDVVNSGGVKMLHFEQNNLAYKIVDILSVTGEFPTSSLYLVGKERVVKALVKKLTQFEISAIPIPR